MVKIETADGDSEYLQGEYRNGSRIRLQALSHRGITSGPARGGAMMRPMFISQIALNALSGNAVVVLQEIGGTRALPIPIGPLEANAIASELEGIKPARPMTHDLLMNLLDATDVKVIKVDISDRKDDTYYALIHILHRGTERVIDARPSDALALSLRVRAPVFVAEKVMRKSMDGSQGGKRLSGSGDQRNWRDLLEDLDPDDLGSA